MKSLTSTPSSSVKSSTTMDESQSCYYPGCKKDANCNCEICLASINATLDLMPFSVQKTSLTKLSYNNMDRTPISFDPSFVSTPRSSCCNMMTMMESPALKSTARFSLKEEAGEKMKKMKKMKKKKKNREMGSGFLGVFFKLVSVLSLIFAVEFGFSWVVSGVLKPELSPEIVRSVGERSWIVQDLSRRLRFLQNELKSIVVDGRVSNCSFSDSKWEINQDGLLLNSRCVLYKSTTEEVSIWGWPLQTAGLLTAGFSSRSLTILSGRVTEWSNGKVGFSIRRANTSWVHKKWSSSVMQLDNNTWILEYRQSKILDSSKLLSAALELLNYRISRLARTMNEEHWLFSAFQDQYKTFMAKEPINIPPT
ncbi:hypothetical protein Q3G72_031779 [Acer saccharum]|nr:hypothetical protein Q3G72_031779 [Acer saccharum]